MPGTDRLLSGVRTTYAVVVVPEKATSLVLESNGCYFPRSAYQPNNFSETKNAAEWGDTKTSRGCGAGKAFIVKIPGALVEGSNDFFVSGVAYFPVDKGQRIVVNIYGENFSSQTGVLVNGVPLKPTLGLAQPFILDDSTTTEKVLAILKDEKVQGVIERVDANQIIATFSMPPDFVGTPIITVVAPGKAIDLNVLDDLYINKEKPASLSRSKDPAVKVSEWMFGKKSVAEDFKIDSLELFPSAPGRLSALINGEGFSVPAAPGPPCEVFVNGVLQPCRISSHSLLVSEFPAPRDELLELTIVNGNNTMKWPALSNPSYFKVESVSVTSYEPRRGRTPGALALKIAGSGFTTSLRSTVGQLVITSPTEATLTIFNPSASVKVTLFDRRLDASFTTVVRRPAAP